MTRQTSIDAYNTIKENGLLSQLRFSIYDALYMHGPSTALELYENHFKNIYRDHSITPRFSELKKIGVVHEVGQRACKVSGNNAIIWDVTDKLPIKLEKKKSKDQIIKELQEKIKELEAKISDLSW